MLFILEANFDIRKDLFACQITLFIESVFSQTFKVGLKVCFLMLNFEEHTGPLFLLS